MEQKYQKENIKITIDMAWPAIVESFFASVRFKQGKWTEIKI